MLPREPPGGNVTAYGSRYKELLAMPRLSGCRRNRAAARNALVGRETGPALDVVGQQLEGALSVRLDQLELREGRRGVLVGLYMIAVLHLVETVRRPVVLPVFSIIILLGN